MLNNMTKCDLMLVLLRDFHNERSAAIRCDLLAALLDLEPRQVQRMVHKLRHEGHPICRDADGYYYASCPEDIECTARWLMTLGWCIQKTACAMLTAADLDRNASCALVMMEEAIKSL